MTLLISHKKTYEEVAVPKRATEHSAGDDVQAFITPEHLDNLRERKIFDEKFIPKVYQDSEGFYTLIEGGAVVAIPTALKFQIPSNFAMLILPRSGISLNKQLSPINSPGLLDADYRGELFICLKNHSSETQVVKHKERVAQLVYVKNYMSLYVEKSSLSKTERDEGGHGSTGE